ncbi:MAG TPA: hypothetical protein PLT38_11380, partial [Rubrivivax sp.]|nr:hypothetical protein [Rubrivivax sp.]
MSSKLAKTSASAPSRRTGIALTRTLHAHHDVVDGAPGAQGDHRRMVGVRKRRAILAQGPPLRVARGVVQQLGERAAEDAFGRRVGCRDAPIEGMVDDALRHGLEQVAERLLAGTQFGFDAPALGDVVQEAAPQRGAAFAGLRCRLGVDPVLDARRRDDAVFVLPAPACRERGPYRGVERGTVGRRHACPHRAVVTVHGFGRGAEQRLDAAAQVEEAPAAVALLDHAEHHAGQCRSQVGEQCRFAPVRLAGVPA